MKCEATLRAVEVPARLIWRPSELVAAEPRLDQEEIDADARKDDEEHHRRERRAHVRVAHLQLVAEEGSVEERAQQIGRKVRAGERALRHVNQIEGVEIADER